ncbi:MAG: T9SS type A sorting domain-containing protein, partial [Bacteroidota bacterium]
ILDSIHLPQGIAYQTRNFKRIERGNCDWGGLYQTCEEIVQHIEPDAENNYSVWSQTYGSIQWDTLYYSWDSNLSYPELAAFYEFTSFRGPQKPSLPHIHMRRGYPREVAYFSQVPTFLPPSDTLTRIHSIASIDYPISSNKPAQGKVSWKNCELDAGPIPDSVQCLGENNSGGISWSIEGEWEKGLGITHIRWEQYPGSYTQTYASKDLVAYRTQLHSFGDFTPESAFCSATVSSSSPLEEGHTIVYPNPAHSTFFIHPDLLASANSLSIFDSEGRNISKGVNIPTAGEGFSVLGYPPGVYFLKIERSQEKSPLWIQLLVAP